MGENGRIVQEWNLSYYLLHVSNITLIVVSSFLLYNILVYDFTNTFYQPVCSPGKLTVTRYDKPIFWILYIATVLRLLVIVFTTMRVFQPKNNVITTSQWFICGIYMLIEIISFIFHILENNSCNNSPEDSPSGINNICNDYRYCCVYGTINSNPSLALCDSIQEGCPLLLAPCAPFVNGTDLTSNFEFTISFSFTAITGIINIFIIVT